MSTNLYVMLATRKSIIDKFTICSIWTDQEGKLSQQQFLPVWAGSEIRQFMSDLAEDHSVGYSDSYFTNPPDLTRDTIGDYTYKIQPSFVPVSVFTKELWNLIDNPIEKTEENMEYYSELVESRQNKIDFLCRLLGAIDCFDQDYFVERYLLYWTE